MIILEEMWNEIEKLERSAFWDFLDFLKTFQNTNFSSDLFKYLTDPKLGFSNIIKIIQKYFKFYFQINIFQNKSQNASSLPKLLK